ncbi:hypothetical protein TURU_105075 [Turdus rufiventris]|nr:hypothetical protein TURU_105075 [Turdus rufiventris]
MAGLCWEGWREEHSGSSADRGDKISDAHLSEPSVVYLVRNLQEQKDRAMPCTLPQMQQKLPNSKAKRGWREHGAVPGSLTQSLALPFTVGAFRTGPKAGAGLWGTPPAELHSAPGLPAQEQHGPVGASPEVGHQDDHRDGAPLPRGKAGRTGIVQPGKEKLWGDLIVAFQYPKGADKKDAETIYKSPE